MGIIIPSLLIIYFGCTPAAEYLSQLDSQDPQLRGEAALALGLMGSRGMPAVDKLIHIVRRDSDLEVRRLAVDALGMIQPTMTAELCDAFVIALNDEDIHLRRAAVIAIGRFSNFPPNIITMLQKHLNDEDRLVRELVMSTFERIGHLGLRSLIRACKDPDDQMRLGAIVTLGRLGEYAQPAVNVLKDIEANDQNSDVKKAAKEALRVITQ